MARKAAARRLIVKATLYPSSLPVPYYIWDSSKSGSFLQRKAEYPVEGGIDTGYF